ncbi:MAG: class I SAM-dependent methyltransferase [Pelotomaculum sp.]|jgi:ubiquinone/menaquinone biosynthesis C-methylase UbiE
MEMNVPEFDKIAREVFAPVYPVLAVQIQEKSGKNSGVCLDIGCGGGYLGIAMAKLSDFNVYLFDQSEEMLQIAAQNIITRGVAGKVQTLWGDVHEIPLADETVDLAMSRGSVFFWEDHCKAFQEIYRVLKPGGVAIIGGGFGSNELKDQIAAEMEKRGQALRDRTKKHNNEDNLVHYEEALRQSGIATYSATRDETGLWVTIKRRP